MPAPGSSARDPGLKEPVLDAPVEVRQPFRAAQVRNAAVGGYRDICRHEQRLVPGKPGPANRIQAGVVSRGARVDGQLRDTDDAAGPRDRLIRIESGEGDGGLAGVDCPADSLAAVFDHADL